MMLERAPKNWMLIKDVNFYVHDVVERPEEKTML